MDKDEFMSWEGRIIMTTRDWSKVPRRRRQDQERATGPSPYEAWTDFASCGKCQKPIAKGTMCFTWNGRASHAVCPLR